MDVNKHISVRKDENPKLFSYMDENSIPYEDVYGTGVFDILESDPHWQNIYRFLQLSNALCLSNTIYTKAELSAAEWLTMRSVWRCGYPQPEDGMGYERVTYSLENYCSVCKCGFVQVSEFRIKKIPKWGRRHFMMLNWVGDELFVDDITKILLSQSGLTGFSFRNVCDKKGEAILPDISQLSIDGILPNGLLMKSRAVDRVNLCERCGVTKYHPTNIGSYVFRRETFENAPDIVKTNEIFGSECWTQREIIVSQQFYQFIKKNRIEKSLEFEPIKLV